MFYVLLIVALLLAVPNVALEIAADHQVSLQASVQGDKEFTTYVRVLNKFDEEDPNSCPNKTITLTQFEHIKSNRPTEFLAQLPEQGEVQNDGYSRTLTVQSEGGYKDDWTIAWRFHDTEFGKDVYCKLDRKTCNLGKSDERGHEAAPVDIKIWSARKEVPHDPNARCGQVVTFNFPSGHCETAEISSSLLQCTPKYDAS